MGFEAFSRDGYKPAIGNGGRDDRYESVFVQQCRLNATKRQGVSCLRRLEAELMTSWSSNTIDDSEQAKE